MEMTQKQFLVHLSQNTLERKDQKFSSPNELLKASKEFEETVRKAPTKESWIKESMPEDLLKTFTEFANLSYPIIHEDVLYLAEEFLQIKRNHGTSVEKSIYESMPLCNFIDRLIKKVRPLEPTYLEMYEFRNTCFKFRFAIFSRGLFHSWVPTTSTF